jgi:hypothetical protein
VCGVLIAAAGRVRARWALALNRFLTLAILLKPTGPRGASDAGGSVDTDRARRIYRTHGIDDGKN